MSGGSTTTQTPQLRGGSNKLLKQATAEQSALAGSPQAQSGLAAELGLQPQGIAPLTGGQMSDINQLQSYGQAGTPGEQTAEQLLAGLTGGPIGSSPATLAGMQAWQSLVEPTITSSIGASSGGRGGVIPAALSQSETAAAVPLIQQEIANREAGIGQGLDIGQAQSGNATTALNAEGLVQQNQQEQLTSQFNAQQTLNQFLNAIGLGPVGQLTPLSVGQTSITTPGKF